MTSVATRLNLSGLLGASTVMLVCGFTHEIEEYAERLVIVSLALLAVGTLLVLRQKRYRYAVIVAVLFAVLVALSCQPWYCPHSCAVPVGITANPWHSHDIWSLVHDH